MEPPAGISYRRLPGRTPWFRFGGTSAPSTSLWLGPDHLLKVERSASRETYKRFFFRDIQAVVIQESSRRSSIGIFDLATMLVIFLLAGAIGSFSLNSMLTAALIASPFFIGLIVNLALGRSSQAVLVTAVGTESLGSLSRLDRAADSLQRLAAEITKAQGELATAQLAAKWPAPAAPTPAA